MKLRVYFFILVVSAILAGGVWSIRQAYKTAQENRLTTDLCDAVGNYLEVGNLRSAYEGIEAGLTRSRVGGACVEVLDNGRSFAPPCAGNDENYNATVCRAEANTGVKANILYLAEPFFGRDLFSIWIATALILALAYGFGTHAMARFARRVAEQVEARILKRPRAEKRGLLSRVADWVMDSTGVIKIVDEQTSMLEAQLKQLEATIREESAIRARKEAEVENAKEFMERVQLIKHDMHSPLSTLQALRSEIETDPELSLKIGSSVRGIEQLIDELDASGPKEEPTELTIVEVFLEDMLPSLEVKFSNNKGVTIDFTYDRARLSPVQVASNGFSRVVKNILENAYDALPTDGAIKIAVRSDQSSCFITIDDNGCGIPQEVRPKLFNRGATFGKVNGGGFGLYHARRNMQLWRGDIQCEPLDKGTRFTLILPLVQTGVVYAGCPEVGPIAIIDDQKFIFDTMRNGGYELVKTATSYFEGRKLLESMSGSDVPVLVDQNLGGRLYGTDLISEVGLKRNVYLCTSDFDDPGVIQKAKKIGVPIIPKTLCICAATRTFVAAT